MSNDTAMVGLELTAEDARLLLDYLSNRWISTTDEEHCIPIRNAIRAIQLGLDETYVNG